MSDNPSQVEPLKISKALAQRVQDELGQNVYLCYQCIKCTSGCPVGEYFDWQPNQIMRAIQLGQEDIAFKAETPWLCASCQTCTTRCPQNLDIAGIMDFLTREALSHGYSPSIPEANIFNEAFMREVHLWGRAYELGLMAEVKLRTRDLTSDIDLGVKMFQKGKLGLLPKPAHTPHKTNIHPKANDAIAYYPGCSLHSSATEFDASSRAVCEKIGINLVEPKGWVCCGSSAAHRSDPVEADRLPYINLNLVEQNGFQEVTMPCAACFNRHKTAQYHHSKTKSMNSSLSNQEDKGEEIEVTTLIDTILNHSTIENIENLTTNPLNGLKAVCYYGCLLTRPPEITGANHPENPTTMDQLMNAVGVEVIDWSYKTSCCGASHSIVRPDIVLRLSTNLIEMARQAGADIMVVACPLCHMNLDARQFQMNIDEPMPILYFSQLMAVAFGLPDKTAALHKNLVDPKPLLQSKGLIH